MTATRFYDDRFGYGWSNLTDGDMLEGGRFWHRTPAEAWADWRKSVVEQLRTHEVMVKVLRESLAKGDAIMKGTEPDPYAGDPFMAVRK